MPVAFQFRSRCPSPLGALVGRRRTRSGRGAGVSLCDRWRRCRPSMASPHRSSPIAAWRAVWRGPQSVGRLAGHWICLATGQLCRSALEGRRAGWEMWPDRNGVARRSSGIGLAERALFSRSIGPTVTAHSLGTLGGPGLGALGELRLKVGQGGGGANGPQFRRCVSPNTWPEVTSHGSELDEHGCIGRTSAPPAPSYVEVPTSFWASPSDFGTVPPPP